MNNASDAFVSELSADGGSLLASTYLGGTADDGGQAIARGDLGQFFVTGWTRSTNYPTTPGAYDVTPNGGSDAFVTKLNASLSAAPVGRRGRPAGSLGSTTPAATRSGGHAPYS